jgi:hypothetical protein
MAIGHEQMEVERAALAPGGSVLDWSAVTRRRVGSFLHAYRQETIITSTGPERTLLIYWAFTRIDMGYPMDQA